MERLTAPFPNKENIEIQVIKMLAAPPPLRQRKEVLHGGKEFSAIGGTLVRLEGVLRNFTYIYIAKLN